MLESVAIWPPALRQKSAEGLHGGTGMPSMQHRAYRPRQAQQTVVHQVVKERLPELIEQAELGSYSLPGFVLGELEKSP